MKSNIVLIGMPGSGKSTVGKRFAEISDMQFQDTDGLIEAQQNKALQSVLDHHGLKYFRRIEEQVVCQLDVQNHLIATGGSVIYSQPAMQHLANIGQLIYLQISPATLMRRVDNVAQRGLFKLPSQSLAELFKQRAALYEAWADFTLQNNWPLSAMRFEHLYQQIVGFCCARDG